MNAVFKFSNRMPLDPMPLDQGGAVIRINTVTESGVNGPKLFGLCAVLWTACAAFSSVQVVVLTIVCKIAR